MVSIQTPQFPLRSGSLSSSHPDLFRRESDKPFEDSKRRVDFVLIYTTVKDDDRIDYKRRFFQAQLVQEGLRLENHCAAGGKVTYVKIHAPWDVLTRYADLMKFKMPLKKYIRSNFPRRSSKSLLTEESTEDINDEDALVKLLRRGNHLSVPYDEMSKLSIRRTSLLDFLYPLKQFIPKEESMLTKEFMKDKEYIYNIPENREEFFSTAQRSAVVDFILKKNRLNKYLADGTYMDAYPLHEGSLRDKSDTNMRWILLKYWGSLSQILTFQPLDQVKDYFGVKIGLYFACFGFYNMMLVPASMVGWGCFIYGIATLHYDIPSIETCSASGYDIIMCPVCDFYCLYWHASDSCTYVKFSHLIDNYATVFFSVFMTLWGALYPEFWKRYLARLRLRWDLTEFDSFEEQLRLEYIARRAKLSSVISQPDIPFKQKVPFIQYSFTRNCISFSVVLLMIALAIAAVFGVILFRMSLRGASVFTIRVSPHFTSFAPSILVSITAAVLNLVFIVILNLVYGYVAKWLTGLENPRTESEYDNKLTFKLYLLRFVNNYSSICYIAFFKGKFLGYPGNYSRLFGKRQEDCGQGGCLLQLTIQLGIIMIGNQAITMVWETIRPQLEARYNRWKYREIHKYDDKEKLKQWEEDHTLVAWHSHTLFYEYLELALQFGFITIFVSAFPLAPIFALLHNLLEMRLDARKLLTTFRRPVAMRAKNIGIWYDILDLVGKFAVFSNALIIAFTSDFIPRQYYIYLLSENNDLSGYLNYSLSFFNISELDLDINTSNIGHSMCRYFDYREPPWSPKKYSLRADYWHILSIRLAFVIIFTAVIFTLSTVCGKVLPKVPESVMKQMRERMREINDVILEHEHERGRHSVMIKKSSLSYTKGRRASDTYVLKPPDQKRQQEI